MNLSPPQRVGALVLAALFVLATAGCGTTSNASRETTPATSSDRPRAPLLKAPDRRMPPVQHRAMPGNGTGSAFDLADPAIAHLDPALLAAVQHAAKDAAADGVRLSITSGWRSRAHQQALLDQAVARYGSLEEALRYVSTPGKSEHVRGHAVDIGPSAADSWLFRHGSDYGLCQIFANEVWHFELATGPGGTCPALLPDSTYR